MTGILNNPEIRLIYDVSDFETGADKVIKGMTEIDDENEKTNKAVRKEMSETVTTTENVNDEIAEQITEVKKVAKARKEESEQLRKTISDYKVFGVSLNDVKDKYKNLVGNLKGVKAEWSTLNSTSAKTPGIFGLGTKALKLFRLALIGTGIGALIIALGSLIAFFTRTQRGIDKVNEVMAGFGATVDVIIDRASSLGESLINAFKQPQQALENLWTRTKTFFNNPVDGIKALFNGAKDAAAGLVTEIKAEAAAARDLERARQALVIAERDLRIETAQTRSEIKGLNKDAEDVTKSIETRQAAARRAVSLEQNLLNERIDLAEQELSITQQQNALGESLNADLEKEADLVVTIANLKTESLELQTTLQNKLNILTQQEIAKRQQLQDLYTSLYDGLQEQLEAQEIELENNPITKLQKQQKRDLELLYKQRDELVELAKLTGGDVDGINEAYATLADGIAEQFKKRIEDTIQGVTPKVEIDKVEIELPDGADFDFTEIPEALNFGEKIEAFKAKIFESLNLSPEDVAIIQDSLGQVFNIAFVDTAILDAKIEKNERYIDSLRDTTATLEDELNKQLELQADGADSNVAQVQAALAKQKTLEEQAIREAAELQKERAKAELTGQLASQIGNLSTAATKIFSAYSGIPFAGIALALGSIATMYQSYKAFKEQASAEIRLHKGTPGGKRVGDYFGYVHKGGASDIPGRGDGYRVLNTPVVLGGNEFVSTEPAAAAQERFLVELNQNPEKYRNVDIKQLVKEHRQKSDTKVIPLLPVLPDKTPLELHNRINRSATRITKVESNYKNDVLEKVIKENAAAVVQAIKERPHYFAIPPGADVVTKDTTGTTIKKAATS